MTSGCLHPGGPSGAPTPIIFNQEGITLAPGEPGHQALCPGTKIQRLHLIQASLSRGETRGETESQGGAVTDPGFRSKHQVRAFGKAHLISTALPTALQGNSQASLLFLMISGKSELGCSREGEKPGEGRERDPSPQEAGNLMK